MLLAVARIAHHAASTDALMAARIAQSAAQAANAPLIIARCQQRLLAANNT